VEQYINNGLPERLLTPAVAECLSFYGRKNPERQQLISAGKGLSLRKLLHKSSEMNESHVFSICDSWWSAG
jgi:hypothetical protein